MSKDYSEKEIKNLLESWKDDNTYRHGTGKEFLSQSDVSSLLKDPKKFRSREGLPLLAFIQGSYYHESLLEPHKIKDYTIVDATTRNTKKYKEELEDSGEPILLLKHEKEHIEYLVKCTLENDHVRTIIEDPSNIFEKPGCAKIGGDNGEWFKGRADIVSPTYGRLFDLKTTSDLDAFKYKSKRYFYHAQAYVYKTIFGMDFTFIVCDKNNGNLAMFDTSDSFLSEGQYQVQKAIDVYQNYYKGKTPEETKRLLANRVIVDELY